MQYCLIAMKKIQLEHIFSNDQDIQRWIVEFELTKKELLAIDPFRKGSILKRWQTCRKIDCLCKKDKTFHNWPYLSWTLKKKQKTISTIIPEEFLSFAKQNIQNAQMLDEIVQKLSAISENIIQKQIQLTRQILKNPKS